MRRVDEYWVIFDQEEKTYFLLGLGFDLAAAVKGAVILVFLVFALCFRVVGVEGPSMQETLHDGDWLAVTGIATHYDRGDIVVVTQPWERGVPIIKRIIAKGGDTVDIDFDQHTVSVNGQVLDEPYIAAPTSLRYDVEFPITVEDGKVFVMGDNRNDSLDSRSSKIGQIDENYILGKAFIRFWPLHQWDIYDND